MKATRTKILALLDDYRGRTSAEVVEALPDCNPATVRQELSVMRTTGILTGHRASEGPAVTYTLPRKLG